MFGKIKEKVNDFKEDWNDLDREEQLEVYQVLLCGALGYTATLAVGWWAIWKLDKRNIGNLLTESGASEELVDYLWATRKFRIK